MICYLCFRLTLFNFIFACRSFSTKSCIFSPKKEHEKNHGQEDSFSAVPCVRPYSDDEDSVNAPDNDDVVTAEATNNNSYCLNSSCKDSRTLFALHELKHSLSFITKYCSPTKE